MNREELHKAAGEFLHKKYTKDNSWKYYPLSENEVAKMMVDFHIHQSKQQDNFYCKEWYSVGYRCEEGQCLKCAKAEEMPEQPQADDVDEKYLRLAKAYKRRKKELQSLKQANSELVEAYKEYIKLLVFELNEVTPIAYVHGWRTSREKSGQEAREKIEQLLSKHEFQF